MKKTLILFLLLSSTGCATAVSEYNQGCRDGIKAWTAEVQKVYVMDDVVEEGCNKMSAARENQKRLGRQHLGRRDL